MDSGTKTDDGTISFGYYTNYEGRIDQKFGKYGNRIQGTSTYRLVHLAFYVFAVRMLWYVIFISIIEMYSENCEMLNMAGISLGNSNFNSVIRID